MEDVAVGRFVRSSGGRLVVSLGGQLRHVLTSVRPKMMINVILVQSNSTGI
jgi:hypothetical protein